MALIVGGSVAITFTVAAREYESPELQRRPNVAYQASEALDAGGLPALRTWLQANKNSIVYYDLYIVGPDGKDILGRKLSDSAARRLEFFSREAVSGREDRPVVQQPPRNYRGPRFTPQIFAPDGTSYLVLVIARRPSIFGALSLPGFPSPSCASPCWSAHLRAGGSRST